MKFSLDIVEISEDYFTDMVARFDNQPNHRRVEVGGEIKTIEQTNIFEQGA